MMKFRMMSVYDQAVGAFFPPFVVPSVAVGERSFRDCVMDKTHAFFRNPQDYSLYDLGEFDDMTGFVKPFDVPVMVLSGISIKGGCDE